MLKLPAQERNLPAREQNYPAQGPTHQVQGPTHQVQGPTHQVQEWHYPALGDLPKLEESQPPAQLVWVQE